MSYIFFTLIFIVFSTYGDEQLSAEKRQKLDQFGPLVTTKKLPHQVWPEVHSEDLLHMDSKTAAALFCSFDHQKNYIPNMIESKIHLEIPSKTKNDIQVEYIMDLPWPLGESKYLHGHHISEVEANVYKVEWYMIKNDGAENVSGHATFTPVLGHPNLTMMKYTSHIIPSSFLAGLVKKLMVKDVQSSMKATKKELHRIFNQDSKLLKKYRQKFEKILNGEKAY